MINAAGTLKDFIPKLWAIFGISGDTVYYLVYVKKNLKWTTITTMKDCSNMLVFNTEKEAMEAIKKIIEIQALPPSKILNRFDVCEIIPVVENGGIWYDVESTKEIKPPKKRKS